jgi:hypothetical protein
MDSTYAALTQWTRDLAAWQRRVDRWLAPLATRRR